MRLEASLTLEPSVRLDLSVRLEASVRLELSVGLEASKSVSQVSSGVKNIRLLLSMAKEGNDRKLQLEYGKLQLEYELKKN